MFCFAVDYFATVGRDLSASPVLEDAIDVDSETAWEMISDATFPSKLIDRYPDTNHSGQNLPEAELAMFIFPHGLKLKYSLQKNFPVPIYFTFVFTDEKGAHLYAACLKFFEKIGNEEVANFFKYTDEKKLRIPDEVSFYCPKAICLVSSQPFYRPMRSYLSQIYSMSLSALPCPIEFYIASLIGKVPMPTPGGRSFQFFQDVGLLADSSRALPPIEFSLPHPQYYSFLDLDFSSPLRSMSIPNLLIVFALMLREARIVFVANSNNILTETMETLRHLLFPLTWSTTYVSRLPHSLTGLFEALGGYLIGVNVQESACVDTQVNWRPVNEMMDDPNFDWLHQLAIGTYVVDLTSNRVFCVERDGILPMPLSDKTALLAAMPTVSFKRIQEQLTKVCASLSIGPQKNDFEIFDSAFEYEALEFPTLDFRDMFLMLMVDILGDYSRFISPPSTDFSADTFRTFNETFLVDEYIRSAEPNVRPLLSALTQTQMFGYFIQQRVEGTDPKLQFYERAAVFLRETGVCPSGTGKKATSKAGVLIAPIYESLETDSLLRYHSALTNMETEHQVVRKNAYQLAGVAADTAFNTSGRKKGGNRLFVPATLNLKEGDFIAFFVALKQQQEDHAARRNPSTRMAAQRRRSELSIMNVDDLHLHDKLAGPLLIPGQLSIALSEEVIETVQEFGDALLQTVNYDGVNMCTISYGLRGWPVLRGELFDAYRSPVDARLKDMLNLRKAEFKALASGLCHMTRSSYEREPFYYRCATPFTASLETNAVAAVMLDLFSTSILMLSVRTKLLVKPVSDVLQILGILAEIEEKGLLSFVDEAVWRCVLLSCAWTGGSFMRQVAWTVFEVMQTLHVPFGCATYGAFVRAVSATTLSKFESFNGNQIDPFMYLEEMGLAWFLQRYAISQSARKSGHSTGRVAAALSPTTTNPSPTKWSILPSSSWFRRQDHSTTNTVDAQLGVIVNAATYTAAYLSLDRQFSGVLSCYQPRHFLWLVTPIHVSMYSHPLPSFSPLSGSPTPGSPIPGSASGSLIPGAREALVRELSKRLEKLYNDTDAAMYSASLPSKPHTSVDNSSQTVTSTTRKLPKQPSAASLASSDTAADSSEHQSTSKELQMSSVHKRWTTAKSEFSDEEGDCSETSGDVLKVGEDSDIDSDDEPSQLIDGIAISSKGRSRKSTSRRLQSQQEQTSSENKSRNSSPTKPTLVAQQQQSSISEIDELKESVTNMHVSQASEETASHAVNPKSFQSPTRSGSERKALSFDTLELHPGSSPPPRSPVSKSPTTKSPASKSPASPANRFSPARRLATETPTNWVSNLEHRILQAIRQDITCTIGIHSRTPCRCGYSLLDDEMLAHTMFCFSSWPFSKDGKKTHLPSYNQPQSSLTCPQCYTVYNPKLHIHIYGKNQTSSGSSDDLIEHWATTVKYMSPKDVRLAMEEIVERVGEPVIEPKYMQQYRPELYWNLIWYGCRVGLPLGFLAPDVSTATIELFEPGSWSPRPAPSRTNLLLLESLKCPVVVGWREDIVRVKARNLFAGRPANELQLSDIFPNSESEERLAHLQFIAELLDGSLSNMKKAIFLYRRYAGLLRHLFRSDAPRRSHSSKEIVSPRQATDKPDPEKPVKSESSTGTAAREMFVGLLFLAYFFKKASVMPRMNSPSNTSVNASGSAASPVPSPAESIPFCKAYLETVRHGLSTLDFQKLRLLKKEMMDSVSSEAVQAARLGFGVLF